MSLLTNGWDYIYAAYLGSVGKALRKDALFKDITIDYKNIFELKIVAL